jgi:hypothetical protein
MPSFLLAKVGSLGTFGTRQVCFLSINLSLFFYNSISQRSREGAKKKPGPVSVAN